MNFLFIKKSSSPSPTWVLGVANPPFRWAGWAVTSQVGFGVVTWWEGDTDTKASPTAASSRQPATSTATRVAPCPLEDVWRPMAYHSLGQWRFVWALQQKHHRNRVSKQIVSHLESSAPNTRKKKTCVFCLKRCIFTRGCEKSDTSQGSQRHSGGKIGPQHHSQPQKVWKVQRQQLPPPFTSKQPGGNPNVTKFRVVTTIPGCFTKKTPILEDFFSPWNFFPTLQTASNCGWNRNSTRLSKFTGIFTVRTVTGQFLGFSCAMPSGAMHPFIPSKKKDIHLRSRQSRNVENIPGRVRHLCPSPVKKTKTLQQENASCSKSRSLLVVASHVAQNVQRNCQTMPCV